MKLLGKYQNGNYNVSIYDDGTKVRENDLDFFKADSPESFDFKICDRCDMGCPFCHENSTPDGEIGDIMNLKFIEQLHPYTEIAIGGGNPLEHPDLIPFLHKCKELNFIPSMTVNQVHFMKNIELLKTLASDNLIYGLGVSLSTVTEEFIDNLQMFPNAVIHIINGIVSEGQLMALKNQGFKILILGYKEFRRGKKLYDNPEQRKNIEDKKKMLYNLLPQLTKWFNVVSFDNLAIKQLDVKRILSEKEWNNFYMGDDGFATMYVDAVKKEFARSSTSTDRYTIKDNIKDMFEVIRR